MGNYRNIIMVGVLANKMILKKTTTVFMPKFHPDTGESYQKSFEKQVYCFNGEEYETDELGDALDELGLETFPAQYGTDWELDDMVVGKEISTSYSGTQCVKINVTPSDPVWTQTQDIIKSTGCSAQVSLFSILDYN